MKAKFNPDMLPSWLVFKDGKRRMVRNLNGAKNRLAKGEYNRAKKLPYYNK